MSHDEEIEMARLQVLCSQQDFMLKWVSEQLATIRALGTVYVYPDDWNYAKEGGSPTIEDYQQIDLSTYAAE